MKPTLQHVVISLFLLVFASCFMMGKAQKMDCILKKVRILVYDLKNVGHVLLDPDNLCYVVHITEQLSIRRLFYWHVQEENS